MVRLAVSTVLIVVLLYRVNLAELHSALHGSIWWLFGLSTFVIAARIVLAAYRWRRLLKVAGIHVSLYRLSYWYYVALFFNMFLPTVLGGDIVRIYRLAQYSGRRVDSVAIVFMERLIGMLAMIGLAVAAVALSPQARQDPRVYVAVLAIAGLYALAFVAVFQPRLNRLCVAFFRRLRLERIANEVHSAYAAFYALRQHRGVLVTTFAISVVLHVIGVICTYWIGLSLQLDVSWTFYFLAAPIIWLLTMLPISINGLGVREAGFVLFFSAVGVTTASALLLSFLTFAQVVLVGLLGGILDLTSPWLCPDGRSRRRV